MVIYQYFFYPYFFVVFIVDFATFFSIFVKWISRKTANILKAAARS